MPGGVLLLASKAKRGANCIGGIPGNMWTGVSSALEAALLAANPGDISRHGNNRNGFCLAAVPVLYRRQPHRLVAHALACQEDELTVDKHRSKGTNNFASLETTSQIIALVAHVWYIAQIARLGD